MLDLLEDDLRLLKVVNVESGILCAAEVLKMSSLYLATGNGGPYNKCEAGVLGKIE